MRKKDQEIFRRAVELADLANARTGMMSRKDWWRRDIAGRLTFWTAKKSGRSLICNAAQAVTRTRAPFVPADFFNQLRGVFAGTQCSALKLADRAVVADRCGA
jgi:hypothetical protein